MTQGQIAQASPVVIVGGCPRSGTTLVRNMLDAHPEIAVPNESPWIVDVADVLIRHDRLEDLALAWELIRRRPSFPQWGLPPEQVERHLSEAPPETFSELVSSIFQIYAHAQGKERAADKTPNATLRLATLRHVFPELRLVHVVRDPREVCMSLAGQHWHQGGLAAAGATWRRHVIAARRAEAAGMAVLELRYERLVDDPRTALTELCTFAGVAFDDAMLEHHASGRALRGPQHERAGRAVTPGLRDWRSALTKGDLATIEVAAGEGLILAGYPPASRGLRPAAAAQVVREKVRYRRFAAVRAAALPRPLSREASLARPWRPALGPPRTPLAAFS